MQKINYLLFTKTGVGFFFPLQILDFQFAKKNWSGGAHRQSHVCEECNLKIWFLVPGLLCSWDLLCLPQLIRALLGLPATLIPLLLTLSFVSGGLWTGTNQSCHVLQSPGLAWSAEISELCLVQTFITGRKHVGWKFGCLFFASFPSLKH